MMNIERMHRDIAAGIVLGGIALTSAPALAQSDADALLAQAYASVREAPLLPENQPRILGQWYDHWTIEPETGRVIGELFTAGRGAGPDIPPAGPDTLHEQRVHINWNVVNQLDARFEDNRLLMPSFDGRWLELSFFHVEAYGKDTAVWFGKIAGIAVSDVILVRHNDVVHMQARDYATPRTWELRYVNQNEHVLRELDMMQPAGEWCATGRDAAAVPAPAPRSVSDTPDRGTVSDPANVVDVMFVATIEARDEYGSDSAFYAACLAFGADFNMRSANSGSGTSLRFAGFYPNSGYNEDSDGGTDLLRISTPGDGHLDWVHAERDRVAADVMALIRRDKWDGDDCQDCVLGVAWRPESLSELQFTQFNFSVTSLGGDENRTFSHEVGHNLGACHNAEENDCGTAITSAPHGIWRQCGACIDTWRTTMSYQGCGLLPSNSIPYWSGVGVTYDPPTFVCGPYDMWDQWSQVTGLFAVSTPTLSQRRIGASVKWVQPGGSPGLPLVGTAAVPYPYVRIGVENVIGDVGDATVWVRTGTYAETAAVGGPVIFNNACTIIADDGPVVIE